MEVGAYVSVKRANGKVCEVRFWLILLVISHFFKYKKGGVRPKNFNVQLLK